VEVSVDSAIAAFPTAKQATLAAFAAQRAVATHEWPQGLRPEISAALYSGEAGIGWVGQAAFRCSELCDAAEGGQIFMSKATASLLEDEDLGELELRDLGEQQTRRTRRAVRAYELVVPHGCRDDRLRSCHTRAAARPRAMHSSRQAARAATSGTVHTPRPARSSRPRRPRHGGAPARSAGRRCPSPAIPFARPS
jgi:hypothetical protein